MHQSGPNVGRQADECPAAGERLLVWPGQRHWAERHVEQDDAASQHQRCATRNRAVDDPDGPLHLGLTCAQHDERQRDGGKGNHNAEASGIHQPRKSLAPESHRSRTRETPRPHPPSRSSRRPAQPSPSRSSRRKRAPALPSSPELVQTCLVTMRAYQRPIKGRLHHGTWRLGSCRGSRYHVPVPHVLATRVLEVENDEA